MMLHRRGVRATRVRTPTMHATTTTTHRRGI